MVNYNEYRYKDLLMFLDGGYDSDTENKNYAEYLLTMKKAKSLRELIKIYKKVYAKILQFLHTDKDFGHKGLDEQLNECLNENIVRILCSKDKPLQNFCLSCLANIRECPSIQEFRTSIVDYAVNHCSKDFNILSQNVINAQIAYNEALDEFYYGYHEVGTNGFKRMRKQLNTNIKVLLKNGYLPTAYDRRFYSIWVSFIIPAFFIIVMVILLGLL